MNHVDVAMELAKRAHEGQFDKIGAPYFVHVEDVARRLLEGGSGPEVVAAGYLHDVIEDTSLTAEDLLKAGFTARTVRIVVAVTKIPGQSNKVYYQNIMLNPSARIVKLADFASNMNPVRLAELDEETSTRLVKKYTFGREQLMW